jgi:glycosyltransferase involved in cell wall biosynthesis
MASGTPVIAYWVGGATETVISWKTGLFFAPQTPEALNSTIEKFEKMEWDSEEIQKHAQDFSTEYFRFKLNTFLKEHV